MPHLIEVYHSGKLISRCPPNLNLPLPNHSSCICGGHNKELNLQEALQENLIQYQQIRARVSKRYPQADILYIALPVRPDGSQPTPHLTDLQDSHHH